MRALSRWALLAMLAATLLFTAAGCGEASTEETDSGLPPQEGLSVGDTTPDFRLKNQDQGTIALSDYKGVSNVILVFYPLAFTPV